jgi:FemAB-related protein (PEP-CTERM system-associated)
VSALPPHRSSSPPPNGDPPPIEVRLEEEPADWNAFVRSRPEATVAHLWEWAEVIREAYGHRTYHLVARGQQGLVGILPVVEVRSRIFGRSLCSMPYLDSGGVVAHSGAAWGGLIEAACELALRLKIKCIDLRHAARPRLGVPARRDKVTLILDLKGIREGVARSGDRSSEALSDRLWKAIGPKTRNQVRKAEKERLVAERTGGEGVAEFYRVWRVNMRDLGSPAHHRRWFESIFRHFGEGASTYLVRLAGGRVIGGLVALEFGDGRVVPWASSDRRYFRLCPNNLLYWTVIRDALVGGRDAFDFGRSSIGSGTYKFKRNWGADEVPLYWQAVDPITGTSPCPLLRPGAEPPPVEGEDESMHTTRDRAARLWRRLPVPVATWLGGHLRGGISL